MEGLERYSVFATAGRERCFAFHGQSKEFLKTRIAVEMSTEELHRVVDTLLACTSGACGCVILRVKWDLVALLIRSLPNVTLSSCLNDWLRILVVHILIEYAKAAAK